VAELQQEGSLFVEDGNHGEYRPRPNEFSITGTPFIRAADLGDGRVLFDRAERINDVALARIRKGVGAPGDVLLSHKGTVGKVAQAALGCETFVCSPQTTLWRVTDGHVLDRGFLYAFLRSATFAAQLGSRKGETDMADYVSLTAQRQLRLPVPPIREQRQIAGVLGALDDKIELNRQMAATARALAHATFQSRYRSDDPELPHAPLAEHVTVARGLSYTSDGLAADGMPLHNLNSVRAGGGYVPAGIKYWRGGFEPRHLVSAGDVIVASVDLTWNFEVIASPARVPRRFGESLFSQDLFVPRPKPSSPLTRTFLYLMLLPGRLRTEIAGYGNGTTVNRIPAAALQKPRFAVPPRELVLEIEAFAVPLFDRAEAAETESQTLAELRDTLLPKLISGELRVRDTEAAFVAGAEPKRT
jgi:type I restriction enzyme, S subunit